MEMEKVLVTGFGPFGDHKINASWEAVKLLPNINKNSVELIVEEIPVSYKDVDEKIKILWETYKPTLVIHVGVSSFTDKITMETRANRSGYCRRDCLGEIHPSGNCCAINEGFETIHCGIGAKEICKELNEHFNKIIAQTSDDAGRYLCEYIFYKSLYIDCNKTMFVHVPPLNKPFSAEELAESLMQIIKTALKQLTCKCNN
ncbi:uncharacterized protein CBL_04013 [Carabus blaptoides fortunei]